MRKAEVKVHDVVAGYLVEDDAGFHFQYLPGYSGQPISKTLPVSGKAYHSRQLFPFFDGLIPEGWMLEIVEKNWKLNTHDRMALLLLCCKECIGAVSITETVL